MTELLPLAEAIAAVLAHARPLEHEPVPLELAAGRYLAEPARAAIDLPPFPSSAMDGYAVRAADTPGRLPITFRVAAGRPSETPLGAGDAMAIATGGVVPEEADAVVPIEHVTEEDGAVVVASRVEPGANVRARAGDVEAGTEIVPAGVRIGSPQIGALAAAGVAEPTCARRPHVALITTGTELQPPGGALRPGEIYESNGLMLRARLTAAGAVVDTPAAIADDETAHREAIDRGLSADVLVTSGGVSVGPHDLVRRIEAELGVKEIFWGVAVRPGKPVTFGVRGSTLVFGLPGNPVSSLVACELFVLPALAALQGAAEPGPLFDTGRLAEPVECDARRDVLMRAVLKGDDDGSVLTPVAGQDSHMIARAAAAGALVLVPRGADVLPAGSAVRFLRI